MSLSGHLITRDTLARQNLARRDDAPTSHVSGERVKTALRPSNKLFVIFLTRKSLSDSGVGCARAVHDFLSATKSGARLAGWVCFFIKPEDEVRTSRVVEPARTESALTAPSPTVG